MPWVTAAKRVKNNRSLRRNEVHLQRDADYRATPNIFIPLPTRNIAPIKKSTPGTNHIANGDARSALVGLAGE